MSVRDQRLAALLLAATMPIAAAHGQDATWIGATGNWNASANWSPQTQPMDTATFDKSGITTAITFSATTTSIGTMLFNGGGSNYTFTLNAVGVPNQTLVINGGGVSSQSGAPNINLFGGLGSPADLQFENSSAAGSAIVNNNAGSVGFSNLSSAQNATVTNSFATLTFRDMSTAANATITNGDTDDGDRTGTTFFDSSTAGAAKITNNGAGAFTIFRNSSTAGNAVISDINFGETDFYDSSSAANAHISGVSVRFHDTSTAGNANISTTFGLVFDGSASAGNATITNEAGTYATFGGMSTAAAATITTDENARMYFLDQSTAGQARLTNSGNAIVDFSSTKGPNNDGKVTAGSIEGTGTYFLGADQLSVGANNLSTTFSGVIADGGGNGGTGGSLIKTGQGVLVLDGVNTFTGGTTILGGKVEIGDAANPGASIAGSVTVGAGGILSGDGTVGGDVFNMTGGIVTPGSTVGTLTIGGNYTQGGTGTLRIEVSPAATSRLKISGTASLAGTLALIYDPGVYKKASFSIFQADDISGTFTTVTGNAPTGFGQSLSYTGTNINLTLAPVTVTPTNDTVFTALGTAALEGAQQANDALLDHLTDLENGTSTGLPDAAKQTDGWLRTIGNFVSHNATGSAPGFYMRTGGFIGGIDRSLSDHLTTGIAASYSHTFVSERGDATGSLDTPRVAVYASYGLEGWSIDSTAGFADDRIAAARPLGFATQAASSSHQGQEATGAVQASYRINVAGVVVVPATGFKFVHLFEASFSETGAPGFDLSVSNRNANSLRPFLGANAIKYYMLDSGLVLSQELDVSWSHEVINAVPSLVQVGGGTFRVDGVVPSRDELNLGGRLTATMRDYLVLHADYRLTLPTGSNFEQSASLGLSYQF